MKRYCLNRECGKELVRRTYKCGQPESKSKFNQRVTCNRSCAAKLGAQVYVRSVCNSEQREHMDALLNWGRV